MASYHIKGFGFSFREFKEQIGNMFLSGVVGAFIGILPGIGGMTANLVAYSVSKSASKHPEKYGKGYMGGLVASETANNACVGGAMIPLFALGIPGDTFTAVMLGAMMVHGLQPGPLVMTNNADFIYGIFVALMLANIFCVILQYFGIKLFVRLLSVPKHILLPIIMVLSIIGAIAINNRVFDAWIVLIFGILGILMNKFDFPVTPIILGFILGPLAETNLRRALRLAKGQFLPLVSNLPSIILICLSLASFALAPRLMKREAAIAAEQENEGKNA
ncbi:MAG: tripartite tricarboxylate transporter permease [Clostridium sp.]|nr:tripartite tricarboxylate transporter permease [Clostridium sp.]